LRALSASLIVLSLWRIWSSENLMLMDVIAWYVELYCCINLSSFEKNQGFTHDGKCDSAKYPNFKSCKGWHSSFLIFLSLCRIFYGLAFLLRR
jgi:hypothetical protein